MADIYIGIDPDNEKSGVGIVYKQTKQVKTDKMSFWRLFGFLQELKRTHDKEQYKIIIEAGWLIKSNWHVLGNYMNTAKAAAMGRSVGMNHQTGILIHDMCKSLDLPVVLQPPLRKYWKAKDGKISQQELEMVVGTDKLPRMNQDQRDALLLAWVCADLPVRVRTKNSKKQD